MSYLVVANFKSHKTSKEVEAWFSSVSAGISEINNLVLAVAPAFPHLNLLNLKSGISNLKLSAQDVSPYPLGSYTGAVAASMLKDLGVKYAIVGHSERRRYFHESYEDVGSKVKELLDQGITPIVCLREEDVTPQSAHLSPSQSSNCYFCFEPEDQIGGVEAASREEIMRVTELIQNLYGVDQIMYGGSVNKDNITSLLDLNLAGFLVAGGSLDSQDFITLLNNLSHHA